MENIYKRYDTAFMDSLIQEEGLEPQDALLVANVEMSGVGVSEEGMPQDRRTACHMVNAPYYLQNLVLLSDEQRREADEILASL